MSTPTTAWTYKDASIEMDRIIRESQNRSADKQSDIYRQEGDSSICSICGHTQHSSTHHDNSDIQRTPKSSKGHIRFSEETSASNRKYQSTIHDTNSSLSHLYTPRSSIRSETPFTTPRTDYTTSSTIRTSASPRTPDSVLILEAKHSANSVITAFRELQSKAKSVETERASAVRIRDELRQELVEARRSQALARNKQELRVNDHYLSIKASTEELMDSHAQLRKKLSKCNETHSSLEHQVKHLSAKKSILTNDNRRLEHDIDLARERVGTLKSELVASTTRGDSMEKRLNTDAAAEEQLLRERLHEVMELHEKEKIMIVKADIRLAALQKYMEIILQVNGDLCEAIKAREDTDNRATRIAEKKLENQLKNREREVKYILDNAESIGASKALEVSRSVNRLTGRRYTSPYIDSSPRRRRSNTPVRRRRRGKKAASASPPRLYDSSLIEAAARMAATAAATSVVAANNSSHCTSCPPKKFIPPSSKSNTEFNVIASVSKAAREAKSLNARVASKVKSLDFKGTGPLYQDVGRVDLEDMHKYLRTVKRMESSRSIG
mmetsp:Transcript_20593/g.29538  ORF Transcript_20593/g.29538 Transcript_20593/m.29538 type:complete len:554 (+) Transcript_20593:84-1745(+)|eukprot:CAMPEP_0185020424 /NCGR_PEP_ID=MMETSP1103-20130426/3027_1 /TAXON_ID=36769 /ORGANISM="Paraphysomonas bandaiensis, Strain Caron Lab Isolate" /LENGTH=553 /DNA_ID=CAMNT_0027551315 /DNA_START=60 /DNA_END=1721 /DNA_ORIENTATION=-